MNGINIYTKAHITDANDQIGRIYIGQEELKVRRIGHNAMLEQDAVHIRLRGRSGRARAGRTRQTTFSKGTARHGSSG